MADKRDLFNIILGRTNEIHISTGRPPYQAFVEWFINLYFLNPKDIFYSDGPNDGKMDAMLKEDNDREITFHVINSKFTKEYNKTAPPAFYAEILQFCNIFRNKQARSEFLQSGVKNEVAQRARKAFEAYDDDRCKLYFITNHRLNEAHYGPVKNEGVEVYHLEDLVQFLVDDLDGAMPRTNNLILSDISAVLTPDIKDTEVSTSIVFGKLKDFIEYMRDDVHDLLFARNIRLDLRNTQVNKDIRETFRTAPHEFAFSNNGITMLCDKYLPDPSDRTLTIVNPRVVNGSQTLHSIRSVTNPSSSARVMIRIIKVPATTNDETAREIKKKKDVVHKISTRTNQQNPVKRWNLVANDDFQLDLFRLFRGKKLFYERREKEWKTRSRHLKSLGFSRGPNIKEMMQLITSARWDEPRMGPFVARTAGEVFESQVYENLVKTDPDETYRMYLAFTCIQHAYSSLRSESAPRYYKELKGYVDLFLFAAIWPLIVSANGNHRTSLLTQILQSNVDIRSKNIKLWEKLVRVSIKHIYDHYQKVGKNYRKEQGKVLTIANYFKNTGNSQALYKVMPPKGAINIVKAILREG